MDHPDHCTHGDIVEPGSLVDDEGLVLFNVGWDADRDVELVRVRVRVLRLAERLDLLVPGLVVLLQVGTSLQDAIQSIVSWQYDG